MLIALTSDVFLLYCNGEDSVCCCRCCTTKQSYSQQLCPYQAIYVYLSAKSSTLPGVEANGLADFSEIWQVGLSWSLVVWLGELAPDSLVAYQEAKTSILDATHQMLRLLQLSSTVAEFSFAPSWMACARNKAFWFVIYVFVFHFTQQPLEITWKPWKCACNLWHQAKNIVHLCM